MSSTLNTVKAINWAKPFLKNQPLAFSNMEPALTCANIILSTMLSAPFKWRFNRGQFAFNTIPGSASAVQCDYSVSLQDFGFLETQWIVDQNNNVHECGGAFTLPYATGKSPSRPTRISVQGDDGNGNITFRTSQMPDAIYTIMGEYQKKAPVLTSTATTIAPVPDEFAFIFHWGFLTLMGMLVNDVRVQWWEQKFVGKLLGVQSGLSDVDINIFLGLWQSNTKTQIRTQGDAQQGQAGRGV